VKYVIAVALPNKKGTLLIQCLSDPISLAYDKRGFLSGAKTDRRELAYESDMGLLARSESNPAT